MFLLQLLAQPQRFQHSTAAQALIKPRILLKQRQLPLKLSRLTKTCILNQVEELSLFANYFPSPCGFFVPGLLFGVPVPEPYAIDPESINRIIDNALVEADKAGISGKNITPFLLGQIAQMSAGNSLKTSILFRNPRKTFLVFEIFHVGHCFLVFLP